MQAELPVNLGLRSYGGVRSESCSWLMINGSRILKLVLETGNFGHNKDLSYRTRYKGVKNVLIAGKITKKPLKVLGYGSCKGINLEYFQASEKLKVESEQLRVPGGFTFLYVGRITRDKGINELVEAFVRLHKEHPNTRLILVGGFEDSLDPVRPSTRTSIGQEENSIEAVGSKYGDDLLTYYAASDSLVLPSYREGFPNTPIEAGAMGLPCIVIDINGSREIIQGGVNGLIVPPKDADALYEAMRRMLLDCDMRERMIAKARPMIAERFDSRYVRQCLYESYDEVMD